MRKKSKKATSGGQHAPSRVGTSLSAWRVSVRARRSLSEGAAALSEGAAALSEAAPSLTEERAPPQ
jgi:hypothetical protein